MERTETADGTTAGTAAGTFWAKVEMVGWMAVVRALSVFWPLADLLEWADARAESGWVERGLPEAERRELARLAEGYAGRASSYLPGTRCLHRALAAQIWLARRGIDSEVVVGLRRSGDLEGHAWLEWDRGRETLFGEGGEEEEKEYREILRSSRKIG